MSRGEFALRFRAPFSDPAFEAEELAIARLEEIAWQAYGEGRKAPVTRKAGPGYADPQYELSVEWIETKARAAWSDPAQPSRVLVICGSARNDGSCPGEMSKTFRLAGFVREAIAQTGLEEDFLDLSLLTSDYARHIHPCKGCVSTAQPLCHRPCSCYPNHALNQTNDWMGLIDAGPQARLDRYVGYYEPYATSHEVLDRSEALHEEAHNVARQVAHAVGELRAGRLRALQRKLPRPRPK
jgi:NADPH-dependent FMN reductase